MGINVLTITHTQHDFGFGRMQFQAARCQAGVKLGLEGLRFLLTTAVHQPIVGIPTPRGSM